MFQLQKTKADHLGIYDLERLFPFIAVTISIFCTTVAEVWSVKLRVFCGLKAEPLLYSVFFSAEGVENCLAEIKKARENLWYPFLEYVIAVKQSLTCKEIATLGW